MTCNQWLKAGILFLPGEWLQYETISKWSLTTIRLNWTIGLLRLINSKITELIRPVNYNLGISQKLIKLEISSCKCSQLECNEEGDETEGYSALYTPFLPLRSPIEIHVREITSSFCVILGIDLQTMISLM